jgi:serine/threonine protein phosphatase 1
MTGRTFAIGDIHGDSEALNRVMMKLPPLTAQDTLVFLGDYVDRGADSAGVVRIIQHELPQKLTCKIVALRGNHEDGWLRVIEGGWPEFVFPAGNGCVQTYRSFRGEPAAADALAKYDELEDMQAGEFFPDEVSKWMANLPYYYEDEHAIYVHAGLVEGDDGTWVHPSQSHDPAVNLWVRTMRFFTHYTGKRVVIGHTSTDHLPPELSQYTPEDPLDMWVRDNVVAIDTGAGKGGFLTCVELPAMVVYESR